MCFYDSLLLLSRQCNVREKRRIDLAKRNRKNKWDGQGENRTFSLHTYANETTSETSDICQNRSFHSEFRGRDGMGDMGHVIAYGIRRMLSNIQW